jgi:hypothetical protein
MDNSHDTFASIVLVLCTLHDDNHLPIIDCESLLECILGAEEIIDHHVETSTYLALCNAGIAHHHFGQFGNGRVEGRLAGYILVTSDNLADAGISLDLAREMTRLQANVVPPRGVLHDVNYDGLPKSEITF